MKKLTLKQIEMEMKNNDTNMYFLECSLFVKRYSHQEFQQILKDEIFCRGLKSQLEKMLYSFEQMEEYSYCIVVRDYLKDNEDTYLY